MDEQVKAEIQKIFSDRNWRLLRYDEFPNRVYWHAAKGLAAIVVERGRDGDFAVSQAALQRLLDAEAKKEKVRFAFVVLRERRYGALVAAEAASVVQENLRSSPPLEGPYGPYWWIGETFQPQELAERPM